MLPRGLTDGIPIPPEGSGNSNTCGGDWLLKLRLGGIDLQSRRRKIDAVASTPHVMFIVADCFSRLSGQVLLLYFERPRLCRFGEENMRHLQIHCYRNTLGTDEAKRTFDELIERLLSQRGVDYVREYVDGFKAAERR